MRVIKYIAGTIGYGIRFYKQSNVNNLCMYCDAVDVGYKSRTGIVVMYAGGAT